MQLDLGGDLVEEAAALAVALPAILKAMLVFAGTLLLSWGATAAIRSMPLGARVIGTERRVLAKAPRA